MLKQVLRYAPLVMNQARWLVHSSHDHEYIPKGHTQTHPSVSYTKQHYHRRANPRTCRNSLFPSEISCSRWPTGVVVAPKNRALAALSAR